MVIEFGRFAIAVWFAGIGKLPEGAVREERQLQPLECEVHLWANFGAKRKIFS
jgi:hypothetical protein